MQSITRSNILTLYKELFKHIQYSNGKNATHSSIVDTLRHQFKQNKITSYKYCRQQNELYFVAQTYLSHLKNLSELNVLKEKYYKGERTTAQAATLVGLKLPKQYQE